MKLNRIVLVLLGSLSLFTGAARAEEEGRTYFLPSVELASAEREPDSSGVLEIKRMCASVLGTLAARANNFSDYYSVPSTSREQRSRLTSFAHELRGRLERARAVLSTPQNKELLASYRAGQFSDAALEKFLKPLVRDAYSRLECPVRGRIGVFDVSDVWQKLTVREGSLVLTRTGPGECAGGFGEIALEMKITPDGFELGDERQAVDNASDTTRTREGFVAREIARSLPKECFVYPIRRQAMSDGFERGGIESLSSYRLSPRPENDSSRAAQ